MDGHGSTVIGRLTVNILVLCDDYWHPAITGRQGLTPLEKDGYSFSASGSD